MTYFRRTGFLRLALPVMVMLILASCGNFSLGIKKTPTPSAKLNALYDQMTQASKSYERALLQIRDGDEEEAKTRLSQSLDQLRDAAVSCGVIEDCDSQRFFSVFDHLLRLKDSNLTGDELSDDGEDDVSSDDAVGLHDPDGQTQDKVILLHGQKLSDLIAMNGAVKAALEMWLTQWRPTLMDAYVNYMYLRYQLWPQYKAANLPEALLFGIIAKESHGKVSVVSSSGAAGLFQLMYATGLRFGLKKTNGFDARFDSVKASRASAAYLNEQLHALKDNLELTLAAYNTGENRLRRLVGRHTSMSFYNRHIYDQVPRETREYVPEVLAAAWLFLHPKQYNLHFPKIDGKPGQITLRRPASMAELTVCLGEAANMQDGWFRTLRNLNPRLGPQKRYPAGTVLQVPLELEKPYALRCVNGPWPDLASELHAAAAPRHHRRRMRRYTVRHGDTLSSIALRYRCSNWKSIQRLNGIPHHMLHIGQVLKIPYCRRRKG